MKPPLRFERAANHAQPRINPVGDECWDDCASISRAACRHRRMLATHAVRPRSDKCSPPGRSILDDRIHFGAGEDGDARQIPVPWMLEAAIVLPIVLGEDPEAAIVAALLVVNAVLHCDGLAFSSRRQSTPMTSSTMMTSTSTPRPPLGP
ncbi:MAG: hypothetical protein ACSLFJ_11450 [Immundisolibacter sp.]|uniref:hypothetical protein n=1 Tax=Immundisolibacter sp. TaxID=1934948 RepID=UPI003EE23969